MNEKKKGFFSGLFTSKKSCCCSSENSVVNAKKECICEKKIAPPENKVSIKIIGSGCKSCISLAENTKSALANMQITATLEKVTDLVAIAGYGIMSLPALVVNEKVVSVGKVLSPKEIVALLRKFEE